MKVAVRAATIAGILLVLLGIAWLVLLATDSEPTTTESGSAAVSDPGSGSFELRRVQLADDDLGTGSVEFSAVALNEEMNRLVIADDGDRLFEFELAADGSVMTPPRRSMRVEVGAGDLEGIVWLADATYAVAHENDGSITVLDLGDTDQVIDARHLQRTVETFIAEGPDGNGVEGVAYVPPTSDTAQPGDVEFYVVHERPPALHAISAAGNMLASAPIPGIVDASDVALARDGTVSVLSDESRVLIDFTLDNGVLIEVARMNLEFQDGRFEQPEGLVRSRDGSRLYVVGEAPGEQRFSFGFWQRGP